MPYLNETGLSYYDPKLKEWISSQPVKTLPTSLYPWTLTEKAGAVTCWPVGGTPLLPTVDFMFTETPPANGEPKAPDNPSTITGVSEVKVTRCGKNLLHLLSPSDSTTIENVSFTVNQDGSVLVNGTATADAALAIFRTSDVNKRIYYHNKPFTLHGCPPDGGNDKYYIGAQYRNVKGTVVGSSYDRGSGVTFNATYGYYVSYCGITVKSGYTANNLLFKPQLEFGTVATDFEPYVGNHYTLPLNNTYYGGSIDLATGLMTVTHFVAYIDSSASFIVYEKKTNTVALVATLTSQTTIPNNGEAIAQNSSCDYFPCSVYNNDTEHIRTVSYVNRQFRIFISYSTLGLTSEATNEQIIAAAASWFTNHPATLVLGLTAASWYTVQLSPTQILSLPQPDKYTPRLNTVYTDASTVQVGYVKSSIREEYELQQAIVAQGGNV